MDNSMQWARMMESKGYTRDYGLDGQWAQWSKGRHAVALNKTDMRAGKSPRVRVWPTASILSVRASTANVSMSELSSLLDALDDVEYATACVGMEWAMDIITPMLNAA